MMFSRRLVARVAEAMKTNMVTVQNVTSFVRQFVMVTECTVGSSLAIDGTLVVTITAAPARPTALQVLNTSVLIYVVLYLVIEQLTFLCHCLLETR